MFGEHMQELLKHTTEPEPEETSRELTVAEALQIAVALHQDGRREEADVIYKEILKVDPTNRGCLALRWRARAPVRPRE